MHEADTRIMAAAAAKSRSRDRMVVHSGSSVFWQDMQRQGPASPASQSYFRPPTPPFGVAQAFPGPVDGVHQKLGGPHSVRGRYNDIDTSAAVSTIERQLPAPRYNTVDVQEAEDGASSQDEGGGGSQDAVDFEDNLQDAQEWCQASDARQVLMQQVAQWGGVARRAPMTDVEQYSGQYEDPAVFPPNDEDWARSRSGHQVAVVPQISSEEHITVVDDVGEASSEDDLGNLVVDVGESSEDDIDPALATPEKGEEALNDPEEQEGVVTSEPALRESDERLEELRELGIQDDCE